MTVQLIHSKSFLTFKKSFASILLEQTPRNVVSEVNFLSYNINNNIIVVIIIII